MVAEEKTEFGWILEEARRRFKEGMNWVDFFNMFHEKGSSFMPIDRETRIRYLHSPEFKEIQRMKCGLKEEQPEVVKPEYSGKMSIRMPKMLHRELAELAKKEGVSINQLMVVFLGQAVVEYKKGII